MWSWEQGTVSVCVCVGGVQDYYLFQGLHIPSSSPEQPKGGGVIGRQMPEQVQVTLSGGGRAPPVGKTGSGFPVTAGVALSVACGCDWVNPVPEPFLCRC